jgi:thymidylate kinase
VVGTADLDPRDPRTVLLRVDPDDAMARRRARRQRRRTVKVEQPLVGIEPRAVTARQSTAAKEGKDE